jgi:hypothetical protein
MRIRNPAYSAYRENRLGWGLGAMRQPMVSSHVADPVPFLSMDPGWKKTGSSIPDGEKKSGSGKNIANNFSASLETVYRAKSTSILRDGKIRIRDKHPGSTTLVSSTFWTMRHCIVDNLSKFAEDMKVVQTVCPSEEKALLQVPVLWMRIRIVSALFCRNRIGIGRA